LFAAQWGILAAGERALAAGAVIASRQPAGHDDHGGAECPACATTSRIHYLIPDAIERLERLRAVTSTRRARRARPPLASFVSEWAEVVGSLLLDLGEAVAEGALASHNLHEFDEAFFRVLGDIFTAQGFPQDGAAADAALLGDKLARLERRLEAALEPVLEVAVEPPVQVDGDVVRELLPTSGSRVPTGPPSAGHGPRLCAA